jgi:hypothetical protein
MHLIRTDAKNEAVFFSYRVVTPPHLLIQLASEDEKSNLSKKFLDLPK